MRERQEAERWTTTHELLSQLLELVSIVRVEALAANGVKRWELPDVLRVPRPGQEEEPVKTITPSQFARLHLVM